MTNSGLSDQADRDAALDVTASYIVQAPAGSGKTELLTLRYLKLLVICEQPEQVLAITFTKKAAGEMRQRILSMLKWALSAKTGDVAGSSALHQLRYEICQPVIERDKEKGWHILDNPSRLRVQTIDSFCFYLASQLPVLSRLGGDPSISEDIGPCFATAITNTLALLEQDSPLAEDMALLLRYLDNDVARVQILLTGMLHNREQWLSHVLGIKSSFEDARLYLQEGLEELIRESITEVHEALLSRQTELLELINFMAENLAAEGKLVVEGFAPLQSLPDSSCGALPYWRLLVEMLLTQSDSWRLKVDKRNGFPAGGSQDKQFNALCKQRKVQFNDFADSLQGNDDLLEALAYLRKLPDPAYESRHWEFLSALTRLLEYLGAQLLVSFRSMGVIDYSQTSAAARSALGTPEEPTDLALALDHKIQHILVDEFQDTSQLQLDILQLLTSGWQLGDSRTLFLVGDAMQSCYGFRNANVGIYLNIRENGLATVKLHPLTLQANFRSQQKLVSWVNATFCTAFPARANASRGAVPYSASTAVHAPLDGAAITTELICHQRDQATAGQELEAQRVVAKILRLKAEDSAASIAILVRYRSHLRHLIPMLRAAHVQWQSTDIDRLTTLPIIENLLSLTAAVLNRGDRIAWLAILRAPWCGLTTADLHAIHSHAGEKTIWHALQKHKDIAALSTAGQEYLEGFVAIMGYVVAAHRRLGLRDLIETAWDLLRGSSLAATAVERDSVSHFFHLLERNEAGGSLASMSEFADQVKLAFIPPSADQSAGNSIHLLTMHKAKGLEFDHVILPGLANKGATDRKSLLLWHERLNRSGQARLFIAALSASGADEGLLYKLLQHEQQHKNKLEDTRLLYIATTRAHKSVSLFASLPRNSKGAIVPRADSLLSRIWRELQHNPQDITELELDQQPAPAATAQRPVVAFGYADITPIKRYRQALSLAAQARKNLAQGVAQLEAVNAEASAEGPTVPAERRKQELAALSGTLIHRQLESCVQSGSAMPEDAGLRNYWRLQLRSSIADDKELETTLDFIQGSVVRSLASESAWIFDAGLRDSEAELGLSSYDHKRLRNYLLDRCFIDAEGTRWIIDYKSATAELNQSEQGFIDAQIQLHSAQLSQYKNLFLAMESRPTKTALYLTSIAKLVELD
ncbi:MAG TPA: hypothetical protein EYG42_07655 [Porticoccaceae bacterium]|nr:hypothetical protein [Porticoccaceae bacterium]